MYILRVIFFIFLIWGYVSNSVAVAQQLQPLFLIERGDSNNLVPVTDSVNATLGVQVYAPFDSLFAAAGTREKAGIYSRSDTISDSLVIFVPLNDAMRVKMGGAAQSGRRGIVLYNEENFSGDDDQGKHIVVRRDLGSFGTKDSLHIGYLNEGYKIATEGDLVYGQRSGSPLTIESDARLSLITRDGAISIDSTGVLILQSISDTTALPRNANPAIADDRAGGIIYTTSDSSVWLDNGTRWTRLSRIDDLRALTSTLTDGYYPLWESSTGKLVDGRLKNRGDTVTVFTRSLYWDNPRNGSRDILIGSYVYAPIPAAVPSNAIWMGSAAGNANASNFSYGAEFSGSAVINSNSNTDGISFRLFNSEIAEFDDEKALMKRDIFYDNPNNGGHDIRIGSNSLSQTTAIWMGTSSFSGSANNTNYRFAGQSFQNSWTAVNSGGEVRLQINAANRLVVNDTTIRAGSNLQQAVFHNYQFNADQDTTGLDGQVMTFNSSTGEIELQSIPAGSPTANFVQDTTGSGGAISGRFSTWDFIRFIFYALVLFNTWVSAMYLIERKK